MVPKTRYDSMRPAIEISLDEQGVLVVTLNRPEKRNALDVAAQRLLREAFQDAARDPGVRVLVLTGGGGAFSSGGDLNSIGKSDSEDSISRRWSEDPIWGCQEAREDRLQRTAEASLMLHKMPKPTIAMVRGVAAGAGMSLALACDFRIVSDNAIFKTSFARIGVSGDYGGSYFLTKLVGPSKAKELYMLGESLDAQAATQLGLVTRLVADDRLEAETHALAHRLATAAPIALRYIKENINAALDESVEKSFSLESRNMVRTLFTEDSKEAVAAFQEKREPVFKGR
jgi:2-(1,2-epoxy-1,2-dihydrophenyl)acetyl-CoA isomerase